MWSCSNHEKRCVKLSYTNVPILKPLQQMNASFGSEYDKIFDVLVWFFTFKEWQTYTEAEHMSLLPKFTLTITDTLPCLVDLFLHQNATGT